MKKWIDKTNTEKTMDIIAGIAFFVWLACEWLENANKLPQNNIVTGLAACAVCICEAVAFWNEKRAFSYVAIAGAVLLIAVSVLIIL